MHVIGDIDGRNCVIMDDMIDTAGTLVKAAEVLKERGAKKVYAYCTHPIFSGPPSIASRRARRWTKWW
jgi:ribose-phosphate pyrophosphokinase